MSADKVEALLAEVEARAAEDFISFRSDDIAANAIEDVPRLVAALRFALDAVHPQDRYDVEWDVRIILRGGKP